MRVCERCMIARHRGTCEENSSRLAAESEARRGDGGELWLSVEWLQEKACMMGMSYDEFGLFLTEFVSK